MELKFKVEVNAKAESVWPYYAEASKRYIWEEDLENLTFNGEIKSGTTGKMKLKEMPEMTFTLVNIDPNVSFWDRTDVPGMGSLFFKHDIITEEGKTYIQHSVSLEKENISEKDLSFLLDIFSDVPKSTMIIKREVEK